ncbi:MAG TPA: hypothetical protein VFE17_03710 [Candidatus Baltobacteraceae bacterium]|nr:hypothetical protein [Candidatus Baltobacteraceae bacterium]
MNYEALYEAAATGDTPAIAALLASPETIPRRVAFNALLQAVSSGQVQAMRAMLDDARFSSASQDGTLVHLAVRYPNVDMIKAYLGSRHVGPYMLQVFFSSALNEAIRTQRNDLIELLLSMEGFTFEPFAFRVAARERNARAMELLLADPRGTPPDGLLTEAAQAGDLDVIRAILRDARAVEWFPSALLNLRTCSFEAARLILSDERVLDISAVASRVAQAGRSDIVAFLLQDERLDPARAGDVLSSAVELGHTDVARMLLKDGRWDPTHASTHAMAQAASRDYLDIVELFLEDQRIINEPNRRTIRAALTRAATSGANDVLRRLLAVPGLRITMLPEQLIERLVHRGQLETLRLLLADQSLVVQPSALKEAVVFNEIDILRFFLRDPRLLDVNHEAITQAAEDGKHDAIVLLLASWRDPAERANAAQTARAHAQGETVEFIDRVMARGKSWLECMNALLRSGPDLDIHMMQSLTAEAQAQGLEGATMRRLHTQGWLKPIIDKVFGPGLLRSFTEVFQSNYTTLAQFSALSTKPELSANISGGPEQELIGLDAVMQEVIRRMTSGLSDLAADALWKRVRENNDRTLTRTSQSPDRAPGQARDVKLEASQFRAALITECISRLKTAALALPRERNAHRNELTPEDLLVFRFKRVWQLKAELRVKEQDENVPVRESAQGVTEALERFTTAVVNRAQERTLVDLGNKLQTALQQYQDALSLAKQKVDLNLLSGAQEFSQMSAEQLATDFNIRLARSRDMDLQM